MRGIDYYLPLRSETKIYQRRKVSVEKPMFPGYFFTSFDGKQRVLLLESNHILSILEPSSEDALRHQLEQIRLALSVDSTLGAVAAVSEGRRVRIRGGIFMGIEGVVESTQKVTSVRLNVDMIGQAVSVEVDRDFVELID